MNVKQTLQYCRQQAKLAGQTLRIHTHLTINSQPAYYYYVKRGTDNNIVSNMTLSSAFEYACNNCESIKI